MASPIRLAFDRRQLDLVIQLIQDPNTNLSPDLIFLLSESSHYGYIDIIKTLLSTDQINSSVNNADVIGYACQHGHSEIIKLFLQDWRFKPSLYNNRALGTACEGGHLETVRLLLEDGRIDPARRCNYALKVSCARGHSEIVELLLSWGIGRNPMIDPSASENYCIITASKNRYYRIVKLLLLDSRKLVDPSVQDNIVIRNSCEDGKLDIVKLLIENFGDLVNRSIGFESALKFGRVKIIVYLVLKAIMGRLLLCGEVGNIIEDLSRDVVGIIQRCMIDLECKKLQSSY